jgi:hypothetical protein
MIFEESALSCLRHVVLERRFDYTGVSHYRAKPTRSIEFSVSVPSKAGK